MEEMGAVDIVRDSGDVWHDVSNNFGFSSVIFSTYKSIIVFLNWFKFKWLFILQHITYLDIYIWKFQCIILINTCFELLLFLFQT